MPLLCRYHRLFPLDSLLILEDTARFAFFILKGTSFAERGTIAFSSAPFQVCIGSFCFDFTKLSINGAAFMAASAPSKVWRSGSF